MKDEMIAYDELCHIWVNAFGIEELINDICERKKKNISSVLKSIGLRLDEDTIADIFGLHYDKNFLLFVCYDNNYFFPNNSINDIIKYSDMLKSEKRFKQIEDYVNLYFKDNKNIIL